jgi:anti-anti-sigma regulatory factor
MNQISKREIENFRICLGMTGVAMVDNTCAEIILHVKHEMRRLGGSFSLRDAAKIVDHVTNKKPLTKETTIGEARVSPRLLNILLKRCQQFEDKGKDTPLHVIGELSITRFRLLRNAGKGTVEELTDICNTIGITMKP